MSESGCLASEPEPEDELDTKGTWQDVGWEEKYPRTHPDLGKQICKHFSYSTFSYLPAQLTYFGFELKKKD